MRVHVVVPELPSATTSFTCDQDGNLLTSTDPRGKVTAYTYDADDE